MGHALAAAAPPPATPYYPAMFATLQAEERDTAIAHAPEAGVDCAASVARQSQHAGALAGDDQRGVVPTETE